MTYGRAFTADHLYYMMVLYVDFAWDLCHASANLDCLGF